MCPTNRYVSKLNVNCNNNGTNKSCDFALNVPYTCVTCVPANCSVVCTNGSNFDDYGFIPSNPLVDLGLNHGFEMGYLGMHQLLCKSGIPNCINPPIKHSNRSEYFLMGITTRG